MPSQSEMLTGAIAPTESAGSGFVRAQWLAVERCPACDSSDRVRIGTIPDLHYAFGAERIPLPAAGIEVATCRDCGLVYKSPVPTPAFLAGVFGRQNGAKWMEPHDFGEEAVILRQLMGRSEFDLLDVGAANGALLKACAAIGVNGRRSALDVVRYPGIAEHLAGECIEGFLETPELSWSHQPYDMVTLFDVLEHFYRPQQAFTNLRSLVRQGGLVFVETGNSRRFWPTRFGIHHWWYVRLLEHHIFWSRRPLEKIAATHGFEIVFWNEGRHKSRRQLTLARTATDLLKTGVYMVEANSYVWIARLFGKDGNQPWNPFAKDHFQACLRRT